VYQERDGSIFDLWGSDDDVADKENKFRVKAIQADNMTKVYLEHPDGSFDNSRKGQQVLRIIYEQVK